MTVHNNNNNNYCGPFDIHPNSPIFLLLLTFRRENLPGHFKFKEYCPQVFRNLRERFGIEDLDYQVGVSRCGTLFLLLLLFVAVCMTLRWVCLVVLLPGILPSLCVCLPTNQPTNQLPKVSLTRSPPVRSAEAQGEGLLLHSEDHTLVVKQISSEDVADMHSILSDYHQVGCVRVRACVILLQLFDCPTLPRTAACI